jgi:hypothetical protein
MGQLSVDFLESGMELADDVRASSGMVLLGSGAVISERHIGILKSWGITQVDIKGTDRDALLAGRLTRLTDAHRRAVDAEIDRLFQHNDPFDPIIEELRRICLRRETERVASQL